MKPLLWRKILLGIAAPALALLMAFVIVAIVLQLSGYSAFGVFGEMISNGFEDRNIVRIVNRAVPYFFAGCAIAVGFRMALFNIGVEGQYRIAALIAAWAGAAVSLPAVLHIGFILIVAMLTGAAAAAIPAVLKITRNVNEVVSTIMLNFILGGLGTYLLLNYLNDPGPQGSNTQTKLIDESGHIPSATWLFEAIGLDIPPSDRVTGMIFIALIVGIGLHILITKTRFGFELRASGLNPLAAQVSGVNASGMILKAMLLSGAIAGLVGMTVILSERFRFISDTFPASFGFTGIAVALLGRNTPLGIALAAYLFAFLETTAGTLQLSFDPDIKIPNEMALVMQGSILLSVVIAYELVRRFELKLEGRAVAKAAEQLTEESAEATR